MQSHPMNLTIQEKTCVYLLGQYTGVLTLATLRRAGSKTTALLLLTRAAIPGSLEGRAALN